jgi:hypothetical protein
MITLLTGKYLYQHHHDFFMNKAVAAFFAITPLLVYVIIIGYGGLLANLHVSNPIADVFAQSVGAAFFSFIIIIASVLTTYFATRSIREPGLSQYAQQQQADYVVASPEQIRQAMMRKRTMQATPTTATTIKAPKVATPKATVPRPQPKFRPYKPVAVAEEPQKLPPPDPRSIPPELVTDLNKFGVDSIVMWDNKRQNIALLKMLDGNMKIAEFVTDINNYKEYPDVSLVALFDFEDGKLHLRGLQEIVR